MWKSILAFRLWGVPSLTTHSSELKWVTQILKTDLCSSMAALSYHVSFDYSVIRFPKNNHRRKNMRHFCHLVYNEKGLCNVIGYVSHIGVVLPETSKFSFVCLFVRFYCVSKKHFLLFFKIVMDIDHKHYFKYKHILYLFFFPD